jgi:hypothetical protein
MTQVKGAWKGWSGKTVVELTDGSIWQQSEYHYEYRYAYRPQAAMIDGALRVEGMSRAVRVRRISSGSRMRIRGTWRGWLGRNTVVELQDGSRWAPAEYHYEYHYAYRPWVVLVGNMLQVEGMSRPVKVRRVG